MIRLLSAPARAGGRGLRKIVGAGFTLFARAVSTILGGQMLADASAFVQAFDTMFGGFRERATATYELLRSPGTAFLVVAAPEPDALREAAYFVDRLSTEEMPLGGMVLNRTHPCWPICRRTRPGRPPTGCAGPARRGGAAAARRPGRPRRPRGPAARPVHQAHGAVPVTRVPAVPGRRRPATACAKSAATSPPPRPCARTARAPRADRAQAPARAGDRPWPMVEDRGPAAVIARLVRSRPYLPPCAPNQ